MFSTASVCLFVSVCVFVSIFVRAITSERLNIGRSKLAVSDVVQKSRPSSKVKVKVKVIRDKKRKTGESFPLTMHGRAYALARQYAARSNRRYHCVPPGGDGLRRWKNQRMLSSSTKSHWFNAAGLVGLGHNAIMQHVLYNIERSANNQRHRS